MKDKDDNELFKTVKLKYPEYDAIWIDVFGNWRNDCIHCGGHAREGNTCYHCWITKSKEKMNWFNTDIGKHNNLLEIIVVP